MQPQQGYPGYPPQPQYPPQQPPAGYPPQSAAPANHAPVPQVPTVVDPTFGEPGPSPTEMDGRMVAFLPTRRTEVDDLSNPGQKRPAIVCDIYVLGSGNFTYGAAPKATPPRPYPTHQVQLPALFKNQTISSTNLVRAVDPQVGTGNAVAGVIRLSTIGSKANKPWNLDIDPAANQAAGALFAAIAQGHSPLGTPAPMAPQAPPAGYPPAAQYPPQQPPPAQGGYPAPQPQYPPQQPPQAPPAGYPPQPHGGYPPPPAQGGYPAPQPQYPPAPPGYDPALWATLSPEQQNIALSQPQQPPAPPNPY